MSYSEEDFLHISGIYQYLCCRRLWALIHLEKQIYDGLFKNVNKRQLTKWVKDRSVDGDIYYEKNLNLSSEKLGITGICEVVKFYSNVVNLRPINLKQHQVLSYLEN